MTAVKKFYDQLQFPGHYTMSQLDYHCPEIRNPYLQIIDSVVRDSSRVIDFGCGTGLISNLFAKRYRNIEFTGVDFADSVDYATHFAKSHDITNVTFINEDITRFKSKSKYDTVICQGVLHHIPDVASAVKTLVNSLADGGTLVVGVYHPWGKILKRFLNINYRNNILEQDQEHHPYETSYKLRGLLNLFPDFTLINSYPSQMCCVSDIRSLFNYRNGGLTTYVLRRKS